VLSGAAVALLAGRDVLATTTASSRRVGHADTQHGARCRARGDRRVPGGAESGLLQKPVLDLAVTFQGHHKEHADVLAKTIAKLGGKPVAAKASTRSRSRR
jgi:hypothetical protein